MKSESVTLVRIYIRERENLLEKVVTFLHDESEIAGVTVLRGIDGYSGMEPPRPAFLMDLSLDLPLVVEFFDTPAKVERVIHSLVRRFPLPHIVSWTVNSYKT